MLYNLGILGKFDIRTLLSNLFRLIDLAPTLKTILDIVTLSQQVGKIVQACVIGNKQDCLVVFLQHKQTRRYPNVLDVILTNVGMRMDQEDAKRYMDSLMSLCVDLYSS